MSLELRAPSNLLKTNLPKKKPPSTFGCRIITIRVLNQAHSRLQVRTFVTWATGCISRGLLQEIDTTLHFVLWTVLLLCTCSRTLLKINYLIENRQSNSPPPPAPGPPPPRPPSPSWNKVSLKGMTNRNVITSARTSIREDGSISRIGEMSLTTVSKISVGCRRQYNCLVKGAEGGEGGKQVD